MIVHTILYVADQDKSRDFYRFVLDIDPTLDVPGMTEFKLSEKHILGLMPEKGIKRLLGEKLPDLSKAAGIPRVELYVRVSDPESMFQRAKEIGALELSPMIARDWGDLAGYVLDPDGHVIACAKSLKSEASSLEDFFQRYGSKFLDAEGLSEFYGECAMWAGPSFVGCIRGKDEVAQAMKSVTEYQNKTGMKSLVPISVEKMTVDELHCWTKVKWSATFEKTGDRRIKFDVSYLLRTEGDQNKIRPCLCHHGTR